MRNRKPTQNTMGFLGSDLLRFCKLPGNPDSIEGEDNGKSIAASGGRASSFGEMSRSLDGFAEAIQSERSNT